MIASRRGFLLGATGLFLAAPAIVRVASLMAIKPLAPTPLVMTISGLMPPTTGNVPGYFQWQVVPTLGKGFQFSQSISAQMRGWLVTNYGETTVFIGSHTAEMIDPGGKVRTTPIAFG